MFDYIKISVQPQFSRHILEKKDLEFSRLYSSTTGEDNPVNVGRGLTRYKNCRTAPFGSMLITVWDSGFVIVDGSIHEYLKGDNSGDFYCSDLVEVVNELNALLRGCNAVINNLEFGVNIRLPFSVNHFLDAVLFYKGQRGYDRRFKNGRQISFELEQYTVKLYDKGGQHSKGDNLLRVEIKVKTMDYLRKKGTHIKHLSDLCNRDYFAPLLNLLTKTVESLVITDSSVRKCDLSKWERKLFEYGNNPKNWSDLWDENQDQFRKRFSRFRELMNHYSERRFQTTVRNLISEKWEQLTEKTGTEISDLHNQGRYGNYHSSSVSQPYPNPSTVDRYCRTCGRDISGQNPRSIFCSEATYGREAKRCRNIDSNPRNNLLRSEMKKRKLGLLFDTLPYLLPERRQLLQTAMR